MRAEAYHNSTSTQTQTSSRPAVVVVEDGDPRTYRVELPNMLDDAGLSVYALRLYVHLKRRAGAAGGACFEGTRRMAAHCKMSVGKIVAAKKELEAAGLIIITPGDVKIRETDTIRIVDIWAENFSRYAPRPSAAGATRPPSRRAPRPPVHTVNSTVHRTADDRSPGERYCSPGERKKEPSEERTNEERTHTHHTRAHGATAARTTGAGVGVTSPQSRFGREQCVAWAEQRKAEGGRIADAYAVGRARWLDGTADDEIATFLDRREQLQEGRRPVERQLMPFHVAAQMVNSAAQAPGCDLATFITQLDVSEETRARLSARFCPAQAGAATPSHDDATAAGPGTGAAHLPAAATARAGAQHPLRPAVAEAGD